MEKFKKALTEGSNWLVISSVVVLYIAMGLMRVENGSIVLNDFSGYTWLDWLLWSALTFLPAIFALIINTTFKKEGIKQGKIIIKDRVDEYEAMLFVNTEKRVRGEKEYLREGALKEGAYKFVSALILSFIAGQLFLSLNADGLLKIVINIAMWAIYGASAFGKSFRYTVDELKEWYIIETSKLKKRKEEEDKIREKELQAVTDKKDAEIKLVKEDLDRSQKLIIELNALIKTLKEPVKKDELIKESR